jgi:CBS domain-containing protein
VDGTLDTAARLMWDHDCGGGIVVGDDGRSVGILTDRDIFMAA